MSSLEYVRRRSPEEEKADARATVEAAAARGEDPRRTFPADDLLWCLGSEEEIDRLGAIAEQARNDRRKRLQESAARDALEREIDRVLAEWKLAEVRELRERAEAEARRRLGVDPA